MINPKQVAAVKAIGLIEEGMTVGLGTGSTAFFAIQELGKRVTEGLLVTAVASSVTTEQLAKEAGITVVDITTVDNIDIAIDGADEVDEHCNLVKGGGGALVREKILASNSKLFVVIVDESKLVVNLGSFPLPVEIVPFAHNLTLMQLEKTGCTVQLRMRNGAPFVSDNGNWIADCQFHKIKEPAELNREINSIAGVVESGIFPKRLVDVVMVGREDGSVEELR
jgi:ribose 5-phosphate isomerase A